MKKYKNCNQHSFREIQTENYTANAYFARRRVYCMSVSWRDSDRTMLLVLALSKRRIYTMRLVCFWQKEKKKQYNIPMAFYQFIMTWWALYILLIFWWLFFQVTFFPRWLFFLGKKVTCLFFWWLFFWWLFSRWLFFLGKKSRDFFSGDFFSGILILTL